jgi:hypothetical protein
VRSALRTAVTEILHDDTARACVISVTGQNGNAHVELRTSTTGSSDEVPA